MVGASLYGTAFRLLGRPEEAEEVVQETVVRLYEKAGAIRSGNLRSWLHRVTVNQCLDRLKAKNWKSEVLPENIPGPEGTQRCGDANGPFTSRRGTPHASPDGVLAP